MNNKVIYENTKGNKVEYKVPDYGEITLKIQDGELVHVDRTESIKPKKVGQNV